MNLNLVLLSMLLYISCISAFASAQISSDTVFVAKYKSDKQCAISYTFDDGLEEHFTRVLPEFEKLGFKGTFWINGNTINQAEKGLVKERRISWKDLKKMKGYGHEISNHGWSHKNLVRCTLDEARIEIERNDSIIEVQMGERPVTFCYPHNAKNKEVVRLASLNRVGTRTRQFAMGSRSIPDSLVRKVDNLLVTSGWEVVMIHGITYGYDAFKADSILWNHLDQVKALEDKIWIGTFREVAAYTAEQQNIRLETTQKGRKMTVKPVLSLDKRLFKYPLTMVVRKKDIRKLSVRQNGKQLKSEILSDKVLFDFNPNGGKITMRIN